jgi:IBR domain, a half RING-finger domain
MIRHVEVFIPKGVDFLSLDAQPRMICVECEFATCFTCKVPWHAGQTCPQYQSLLNDGESAEYIRKYCKKCPRSGCGAPSKKFKLCHEMICASGRPRTCLNRIDMVADLDK